MTENLNLPVSVCKNQKNFRITEMFVQTLFRTALPAKTKRQPFFFKFYSG